MATQIDDGQFSIATKDGPGRSIAPLPGVSTRYVLEEDFVQNADSYTPLALNTAHPTATGYLLVQETPLQPAGCGVARWTRIWAKVPAVYWEPTTYAYSFIGRTVTISTYGQQTSPRRSDSVPCRVRNDYFLVPSSGTDPILGTAYSLTSDGDIPRILGMLYVFQGDPGGGTVYGGINLPTDSLNLAGTVLPTWPTSDQYQTMILDALTNGWGATLSKVVVHLTAGTGYTAGTIDTGSSVLGGLIPCENSRVERWMGNIFVRKTPYIQAQ